MTPAEFNAAKFTQLEAILCDSRCAPSVKIVAAHVYTKYLSAEYGFAWVSRAVLTGELGYNDSTVSHAYDRLEQLGYVTIERHKRGKGGPGRGKTNKVHPSFVALNNVAVSQPFSGDGDEIKRCEPRDKTLRATLENVAGPQHDSMKEIKTNEARTSRASPPEGGSRRALSKPRKKDSRQEDGERLDDGEPPVTPEEVRKIMRDFRASLKATEEDEETTCAATSTKSAERLSRQEANWQREVAAVAQHAAQSGNGKWKQEVRDY